MSCIDWIKSDVIYDNIHVCTASGYISPYRPEKWLILYYYFLDIRVLLVKISKLTQIILAIHFPNILSLFKGTTQ